MKKLLTFLGLGAAACAACCIPLIIPAVAGVAASGVLAELACRDGLVATVGASALIGVALLVRKRLKAESRISSCSTGCGCNPAVK